MMIISVLDLFSSFVYLTLILLILVRNPRALINRVCALLFFCFAVWAFTDAFLNSSVEKPAALVWSNLTSFGWCSFASVYLWFTLILIKRENIFYKWYLPVFAALPVLFVFQKWNGNLISDIVKVPYGWSSFWSSSPWAYFYYGYYISFSGLALALTYGFYLKAKYKREKIQARVILLTGVFTLIVSTITDVLSPTFGILHLPNMADIVILVWAGGITLAITRFDLLSVTVANAAQHILTAMTDCVFLIGPEGKVIETNNASFQLLGYSREDLLGLSIEELVTEYGPERQYCLRAKNGADIPVDLSNSRMEETSGELIGTVCVCRDMRAMLQTAKEKDELRLRMVRQQLEQDLIRRQMEEQRLTEAALRESQFDLQQALEEKQQLLTSITSLLITINAEGMVTHWNEPAAVSFGMPVPDVIGCSFRSLRIAWDWTMIDDEVERCRSTQERIRLPEFTFANAAGERRTLGLTLNPMPQTQHGIGDVLILGSDITEQVILQQQVEHHSKLESIGQLAAGVAHEINTPSQFIGANLRFLRDQFHLLQESLVTRPSSEAPTAHDRALDHLLAEFPKAITQSLDGIDRITRIVAALRIFSHPGTAQRIPANLNEGLESTVAVSRNEWKYIADIEWRLDPELPLVECYSGELNQVFLNIIINGIDAIRDVIGDNSNAKGRIGIETRHGDDWVEVHISDSGTGIPAEIQKQVFDPFFTTKGIGRGTGQGLAISYNIIVQKHGGSIRFETEPGRGTTFIIRLPIRDAMEVPGPQPASVSEPLSPG